MTPEFGPRRAGPPVGIAGQWVSGQMHYLRALAALLLACIAAAILAPYATNYISSRAVVNAPLNTVRSPIRGVIATPSATSGTGIEAGATLVAIDLEEPDRRYLEQLTARRSLLRATLAAIEAEAATLAAMRADMAARIEAFRARMIDRLAAEAAEVRGEVSAARARLANAEAVRRRSRALAARGHASATRSEADTAARDEAAGELARLQARIVKIEVERNAADRGISVQDNASDVPYSQQRLDEIRMRSAALGAERRRVAAELTALDLQIGAEAAQTARRQSFRPVAPAGGVVWKPSGSAGETVVPGDVLVQTIDCAARFIEVTLPERHFGDILPGDPARVRLKGGGETVEARVGAVLGAGAKFDHPRLAAGVFEPTPGQLRILIPLAGDALAGSPAAFCNVGRTAEVRFPSAGSWSLGGLAASGAGILESLFSTAASLPAAAESAVPDRPDRTALRPDR